MTIIEITGVAACDTPRQCAWQAAELADQVLAKANQAGADIASASVPASVGVLWTQTLTVPGCGEPVRLSYGQGLMAIAIDRPRGPVAHARLYIAVVEILHAWQQAGLIETFVDILQWRFHKRNIVRFFVSLYAHRGEPLGLRRWCHNRALDFEDAHGYTPGYNDMMSADEVFLPEVGMYADHAGYANMCGVIEGDEFLNSFHPV